MRILITSGGTKVPIDEVRHISNMSSGRYGSELADAFINQSDLLEKDVEILFFHAKGSKKPKSYMDVVEFKDYYDYAENAIRLCEECKPDIIISCAAVSDYIPVYGPVEGKISSDKSEMVIHLKKGPKIIKQLRDACPNAFIVGFKLVVNSDWECTCRAVDKVFENGADVVVSNDLHDIKKGDNARVLHVPNENCYLLHDAGSLARTILERYRLAKS